MNIEVIQENGKNIALLTGGDCVVTDVSAGLELLMAVRHEAQAERLAAGKEAFCEEFFSLRSGLAGEILQKFINYQVKLAIYGDFSQYTSRALRDFMLECSHGRDIFFTSTKEDAIQRLAAV